jgi:hypothetical protein
VGESGQVKPGLGAAATAEGTCRAAGDEETMDRSSQDGKLSKQTTWRWHWGRNGRTWLSGTTGRNGERMRKERPRWTDMQGGGVSQAGIPDQELPEALTEQRDRRQVASDVADSST